MKVRILENPNNSEGFAIFFPYSLQGLEKIKLCLGTIWDRKLRCWLSDGPEVLLDFQRFDIQVEWMSPGARKIAEAFRQTLWDTMDCRLLDLDGSEYAFQQQGSDFLSAMPRAILADDMGTGKSKQSLDAAKMVGANRILVLCNKTLIYNWINEVELWHPDWSVGAVPPTIELRNKFWNLDTLPNVIVANYEQLSRKDWPDDFPWDVVITDEASRFKNQTTNIYKNVRKTIKYAKYSWALTGTPLEKNVVEMYHLFSVMRPSVLGNYGRFREQHLELDSWRNSIKMVRNLTLLQERIAPFILRRTKNEVLKQLPAKVYQNRFVKLSPEEQDAYDHMTTKFNNTLTSWGVTGDDHPLTQVLRMRQFCCTPEIFTKELGRGSKFESLKELVEEWDGKILIFCFFEEVTKLLHKWLDVHPDAYISGTVNSKAGEAFRRTQAFNRGELGKIFISTDAGNQGMNVTGANMIIHYDRIFNAQKMHQREDRLHRIGQTDNVTVVNLMCLDSIDYGIYQLNQEEDNLFKEVVDGAEELILRKLDAPRLRRLVTGTLDAELSYHDSRSVSEPVA